MSTTGIIDPMIGDRRIASWRASAQAAVAPWLVSRAVGVGALVFARYVFAQVGSGRRPASLIQGLLSWDGWHYRELLLRGYGGAPRGDARFFPLYAMAGRALRPFVGASAALLVVASVAAFIAIALVHRIAESETGDRTLARRAAWLTALLPQMFVLTMAYSEAMFMALSAGAFLAMRRRRWFTVAVLAAAASLTRPFGVLLVLPIAIEGWKGWRDAGGRARVGSVVAILSPALGLGAFLLWAQHVFGDALLPLRIQSTPGLRGGFVDPVTAFWRSAHTLVRGDHFGIGVHAVWVPVFIVLIVMVGRRLPASFTVYAAAVTFLALSAANLSSFERYAASAFPMAIGAAALVELADDRVDIWPATLALSTTAMFALSVVVFLGSYVP